MSLCPLLLLRFLEQACVPPVWVPGEPGLSIDLFGFLKPCLGSCCVQKAVRAHEPPRVAQPALLGTQMATSEQHSFHGAA